MCLKERTEGGGRFECLVREDQVSAFIHHSSKAQPLASCVWGEGYIYRLEICPVSISVFAPAQGHAGMKKGFAVQQVLSEIAGCCSCRERSRHPDTEQVWVKKKCGSRSSELMVNSGVLQSSEFTSVSHWNTSVPGHQLCATGFGLLLQCCVFTYSKSSLDI